MVLSAVYPPWPYYALDEINAVQAILTSGKVNQWTGSVIKEFEREYASALGVRHTIALTNGTVALELPLRAMGIGPGDEVIVPSRTFLATASAVVIVGATPVIADIDRDSGNLTADTIRAVLTPRTKAIIPVHMAGWPCEMDPILELARKHGLKVIEDCAQAHGAMYRGKHVGTLGDVGAFSFCQDKVITTGGEGGLVATDDETLWKWMWGFKDHGKNYDTVFHKEHPPGFRWLHEMFGTNWRLTEMQAAIGRIQLQKLPDWTARRTANAQILIDALSEHPAVRVPLPPSHMKHAWYKFYAYVDEARIKKGRDWIMQEINHRGVPCTVGSAAEIYREKAFARAGICPKQPMPVASELARTSLMFVVHPTLEAAHMKDMAEVIVGVLNESLR